MTMRRYFVVGIKPDNTLDVDYWLDSFENIEALTEIEAVTKYKKRFAEWLLPDEEQYIRIWEIVETDDPFWFTWEQRQSYRNMSMLDAYGVQDATGVVEMALSDISYIYQYLRKDLMMTDKDEDSEQYRRLFNACEALKKHKTKTNYRRSLKNVK